MSIPKLKAYRLDPGYSESSDNDIRSLSNDELLPIFSKRFRISEGPEPMVGIRARGDARMVYRGLSASVVLSLNKDESSTDALSTVPCVCDGWVLGKGNLHLKVGSSANNAEELPRHVWDYEVTQKKLYRYVASSNESFPNGSGVEIWQNGKKTTGTISVVSGDILESEDLSVFTSKGIDATSIEVHMVDFISFKIGALWKTTSIVSSSSDGFDYSYIEADYVPYEEMFNRTSGDLYVRRGFDVTPHAFSTLESDAANCGVAFGNIYNGEIDGRSMRHPATGGASVGPIDGLSTNLARCPQYYEGNYMFARKAMPMRIMKQSVADGSCDFTMSGTDVFADGLMKPVLFELVKASGTEKPIFKPLTELQATMQLAFVPDQQDPEKMTMKYSCSCVQSFYSDCKKPSELYLMYNFHDDDLGALFDFDYDYKNYGPVLAEQKSFGKTRFDELSYNTGALSVPYEIRERFDEPMKYVYLRKEILAVENNHGYVPDVAGMKLLIINGDVASMSFGDSGDPPNRFYPSVYVDGKKITASSSDLIYYEFNNSDVSVHGWTQNMHDFLVVFYEQTPVVGNISITDGDSAIVGYRVPCYEKVKTTDLFVSSYPNWLKGHLNNDLDVFYGFKDYQGVKPGTGTETEPTGGWFPCYQQDGWHAMYPEGAVQFSEPLTQTDYLDILNFSYQENNNVLNDGGVSTRLADALDWIDGPDGISEEGKKLKKYHRKVWYNVAHYDGIYSVVRGRMSNYTVQGGAKYRLLEYDAYGDAAGRRWTIGANDTLRRMFEAGNVMMPQLKSNSTGDLERLEKVESVVLASSEGSPYECTLDGDRACYFRVEGNDLYGVRQLSVQADEEGDSVAISVQLNLKGKDLSVKFGENQPELLSLKGDFFRLVDNNDFEMPIAKHPAGDYDIVVQLVGIYRDSASGTTVASYEFSVYRMEHSE